MARADDRPDESECEDDGKTQMQGAERRAWIRYPRRLTTIWQLFGGRQDETLTASLFDISQTGVGLIINRSFPPATVLTVRLQTGSRKFSKTMLVRVKHCSARENGEWLVGCTFVVKLKEAELKELVS
jgi:PilZ domain-containing protein